MHRHGSTEIKPQSSSCAPLDPTKHSTSRATIRTASSHEDLKGQADIFLAKTQEEISHNYNKILFTYGKWNAETYLKILKGLNSEDDGTIEPPAIRPLPGKTRVDEARQATVSLRTKPEASSNFEKKTNNCKLTKTKMTIPQNAQPTESYSREPTYKNIFKNARLNLKSRKYDDVAREELTAPSSKKIEKNVVVKDSSDDETLVKPRKPCKLERDAPNNYLLVVRKRRGDKIRKKVSFSQSLEANMDDVERYYQNRPIQTILENSLEDQIDLMRARLKTHVTDISGLDLVREQGYDDLRAHCLNDVNSIEEFQNMFNDERWRKKFELEKIEASDDADSLDVSDIVSSESDSKCSGDSFGTELDYKPKAVPPSRIPCITEVRDKGDELFDKISMKWERLIMKNFIDAKMKPCYTQFCSSIRVRSTEPVYAGIINLLEPSGDFYTKKFIPHRHRMKHKFEKIGKMQEAKEKLLRERRQLETGLLQRDGAARRSSVSPERIIDLQQPKKYRGENQRHRMQRIIGETKHREKEELADWKREAIMEDYVNLKPMIQTKKKRQQSIVTESAMRSLKAKKSSSHQRKLPHSMTSLRNVETSLFLSFSRTPDGSSTGRLSSHRSKLGTVRSKTHNLPM